MHAYLRAETHFELPWLSLEPRLFYNIIFCMHINQPRLFYNMYVQISKEQANTTFFKFDLKDIIGLAYKSCLFNKNPHPTSYYTQ